MRTESSQTCVSPRVLVVGAGINGAAVARELTLNGISVVVVDANDIAFGATSRSSRLIHGGLRYLERGDFALVRESLRERAILLKTAPDFVQPLRLRIPVRRRFGGLVWSLLTFCGWDRTGLGRFWLRCCPNARERGLWLIRLGLWMYDRLVPPYVPVRLRILRRADSFARTIHDRTARRCSATRTGTIAGLRRPHAHARRISRNGSPLDRPARPQRSDHTATGRHHQCDRSLGRCHAGRLASRFFKTLRWDEGKSLRDGE